MFRSSFLFYVLLCLTGHAATARTASHTSNHAVIVSSSRYWFNYRHNANALTVYRILKDLGGIPDENIILMLADEFGSNPRNPFQDKIYTAGKLSPSLLTPDTEIDLRGEDVTVQNFANILTGRTQPGQPTLQTDAGSNILIYLTGHRGDQFFKFQDVEEVMTGHLRQIFAEMHNARRYQEILFVADTCQAFTLGDKIDSPNITVVGSSLRDESSYAHHADHDVGMSVIEHYTFALDRWIRRTTDWPKRSLQQGLVTPYSFQQQRAHVGIRDDLAVRNASTALMEDFFTNSRKPTRAKPKWSSLLTESAMQSILLTIPVNIRTGAEVVFDVVPDIPSHAPSSTGDVWEPTDGAFLGTITCLVVIVGIAGLKW